MRSSSDSSVIELSEVACSRSSGDGGSGAAVRGISITFSSRRLHLITGTSPGERSLLLRLLSLLETPDSGDVLLDGNSTRALDDAARADLRAQRLGLVFASPFLLPSFSAIENIAMPLFKLAHLEPETARSRAETALEFVGLNGFEETLGADLTRFEQHCVSLARAIAAEPGVLLIEELDSIVAGDALQQFTTLLRQAAERFDLIAIATSSPAYTVGSLCRTVSVERGIIEHDSTLLREPFA